MLLHICACRYVRVHAAICDMMMLCSHAWKLALTNQQAEEQRVGVQVCVYTDTQTHTFDINASEDFDCSAKIRNYNFIYLI